MQGVLLGSPLDRSTGSPIREVADKHMRLGGRQHPHPLLTNIDTQIQRHQKRVFLTEQSRRKGLATFMKALLDRRILTPAEFR